MEPEIDVLGQEPSPHDDFNNALYVVIGQLMKDVECEPEVKNEVADGVMDVLHAMYIFAPYGGVAHDIIGEHLKRIRLAMPTSTTL